jgi:hypothetical protein
MILLRVQLTQVGVAVVVRDQAHQQMVLLAARDVSASVTQILSLPRFLQPEARQSQ